MRSLVAIAAILAVAGCGQRQENAQNAGLPVPGPRPQTAEKQSGPLSAEQAFRQGFRSNGIETCVASARNRAAQTGSQPPGTDFRPVCTCYIDRVMAGLSADQLAGLQPGPREQAIVEQCGLEHGLLQNGGGK